MKAHGKTMAAIALVAVMIMSTAMAAIPFATSDNSSAAPIEDVWQIDLIGDSKTPVEENEFVSQWLTNASTLENKTVTGWNHIPSVPVIVDDYVFVRINGILYKLDIFTGKSLASNDSLFGNNMYGHWIDHADYNGGIILDGLNKKALDMDLNYLYSFESQHLKFAYFNGKLYGIDKTGISVYDPIDADPSSGDEVKTAEMRITYESAWSSSAVPYYPVFIDDYMYVIIVSGSGTTAKATVGSYDLGTGDLKDSYTLDGTSLNADPTYMDGKLYVTTYGAGIFGGGSGGMDMAYSIPLDTANGTIDDENVKTITLTSNRNNSSLIPYSNGFGYVRTPAALHVIDLTTFTEVASVDTSSRANAWGSGRGGMTMTDGYYAAEGKLYFYTIPYSNTQTIIVYCHEYDENAQPEDRHKVTYREYTLPVTKQFNTENVFFGKDGQLIWHNDSGDLFCFADFAVVQYETNGSAPIDYVKVNINGTITAPANPVRHNHVFAGWYTDVALTEQYTFGTPVAGSLTLYAKWTFDPAVEVFETSFESNGGSSVVSQKTAKDDKLIKPTDPVKYGYSFRGWYYDSALTQEYDFNTPVIRNVILYAKWDVKTQYTVTFTPLGGSETAAQKVYAGDMANRPSDPYRYGYTFGGWYTSNYGGDLFDFNNTPVNGNLTIYARWASASSIQRTISFNSMGGSGVDVQKVYQGDKVIMPADPLNYGFAFAGWYTAETGGSKYDFNTPVGASDITLYARWDALPKYTVSFDTDGGSATVAQKMHSGELVFMPSDPVKAGYAFAGWYDNSGFTGDVYNFNKPVSGDFTLYAKWDALPSYNVSFECNGGSAIGDKTVYDGSCCAKPADPVKDGHTFAGWYTDAALTNQHDFDDTVSGHTTLYAKWVASSASSGNDDGNDNTIYYAVGGVAAIAVIIGLVYFLVIRKP